MKVYKIALFFLAASIGIVANASETKQVALPGDTRPAAAAPAVCLLTLRIEQLHWTLNPIVWIQDKVNASKMEIPTIPSYCSSLKVGQVLSSEFRWGSYILRGSTGDTQVLVEKIEMPAANTTTKR